MPVNRPGALTDRALDLERQTGDVIGNGLDSGVNPGELPERGHGCDDRIRLLHAILGAVCLPIFDLARLLDELEPAQQETPAQGDTLRNRHSRLCHSIELPPRRVTRQVTTSEQDRQCSVPPMSGLCIRLWKSAGPFLL